jgi:hypothetical protein
MSDLAYNERVKFTAKTLSNMGIICIFAGILGPVLAVGANRSLLAVIAWVASGVVLGVALHLAALRHLRRLR